MFGLTLFGLAAPAAAADQVPFNMNSTGVVTGRMQLPGGLTQVDESIWGNATHLGDFTGPATSLRDRQGNFSATGCMVGANGKNSVCFALSGHGESMRGACRVTSTGTFTVTSGTGAFANATGGGIVTAQLDECAGAIKGAATGTISQPNSG